MRLVVDGCGEVGVEEDVAGLWGALDDVQGVLHLLSKVGLHSHLNHFKSKKWKIGRITHKSFHTQRSKEIEEGKGEKIGRSGKGERPTNFTSRLQKEQKKQQRVKRKE